MNGIKVISFTGPSGAGKTTVIKELLRIKPGWRLVISYTTRGPRDSDLLGEYRCNVAEEEFTDPVRKKKFSWTAFVHGNYYGHLTRSIKGTLSGERPTMWMLTLTPDAVDKFLRLTGGRAVSFFVLPPEESVLRARLARRGDSEEEIARRIQDCRVWEEEARSSDLPYVFLDSSGTVEETSQAVMECLANMA